MTSRYVPLFWRLFVPNALVLGLACVVLMVEPANGRIPALVGGLSVLLAIDLVLMRRAVGPLERLSDLMRRIDPLHPGERVPGVEPTSEISVLADAFNAMLDRLEGERRDSAQRALADREQEQRRIAEALHDHIGQDLTATALHLARIADGIDPAAAEQVEQVRLHVLETVEHVRGLARQLRPEALDALGLVPAMTNMLERLAEATGVRVVRDLARDLPPLTSNAELVLFRVAQESCTNAVRHAGADVIEVSVSAAGGQVVLCVLDDGVGIAPDQGSDGGIRTMRERAVLLGAELDIGPRFDHDGTCVKFAFDPVTVST